MDEVPPRDEPAPPLSLRRARQYLWRATWCLCPVCGTRPIFIPLLKVRSVDDWLTPLDGCPVCGYAYDREPGYFLVSVWAIGYAASALVGIAIYVYLQIWHSDLSLTATLLAVGLPLPIVNVLFARHAKAYFLALDHFFDPHVRSGDEDDDGGGNGDDGGGGNGRRTPAPRLTAPRGLPVVREAAAAGRR